MVLVDGLTVTEPFAADAETPLSMVTRVAWLVVHERVYVSPPGVSGSRVATKLTISGSWWTVTVTVLVTGVVPLAPVAVSV